MGSNKRINKEIQNMMKDNDLRRNHYCIELDGETNSHFFGKILGAPDTPFQRGVFKIDISIPNKYPFEPPVCKFVTKVWHPNVSSQTGAICLDILKDQWAAAMTVESVLKSLQSFLSSPEPNDPQDAVVAHQYVQNRELYNRTARYWTYHYAMNDETRRTVDKNQFREFKEKINQLKGAKNLDHENALSLLSCCDWDLNKALN
ncbi:unnamed protein product [Medioppia subpectinata]|uniref:UBC core domain-containing protein n=1 Tax=Medioppia subpectinata TaxID=1979941 RepID=A0A7R9KV94_9ACAR|nr:unnamed protein product [Medioppia subpectinata]CAG2110501.1 unnamed protein product [Medioppia subpectinata]